VRDFVSSAVTDLDPADPHRAREWMRTVTALVVWSRRDGTPLDREGMFAPDNVHRYSEIGCSDLKLSSRATRRAVLRSMGRALTVEAPWPEREQRLPQRHRHRPYSSDDFRRLMALRQPTAKQQRRLEAVLALGLGAGLWAREYLTAMPRDLSVVDCITLLSVSGARARKIVVRQRFAGTLHRLAEDHPDENFVGFPQHEWDRSRTWHALKVLESPSDLSIETERLRSTWLVHHLDAGVNLVTLSRNAGLKTTKAYTLLLPYLAEPDEALARRQLAEMD
jgi:hypothetical protein